MIACMTNFFFKYSFALKQYWSAPDDIYSLFLYVDNPPPLKVTTVSLPVARNIPAVATSLRKIQSMCCWLALFTYFNELVWNYCTKCNTDFVS